MVRRKFAATKLILPKYYLKMSQNTKSDTIASLTDQFTAITKMLYTTSVPGSVLEAKVLPFVGDNIRFKDAWQEGGNKKMYTIGMKGNNVNYPYTHVYNYYITSKLAPGENFFLSRVIRGKYKSVAYLFQYISLAGFHNMSDFTFDLYQIGVTLNDDGSGGRCMVDGQMNLQRLFFLYTFPLRVVLIYEFRLRNRNDPQSLEIFYHEEMWFVCLFCLFFLSRIHFQNPNIPFQVLHPPTRRHSRCIMDIHQSLSTSLWPCIRCCVVSQLCCTRLVGGEKEEGQE